MGGGRKPGMIVCRGRKGIAGRCPACAQDTVGAVGLIRISQVRLTRHGGVGAQCWDFIPSLSRKHSNTLERGRAPRAVLVWCTWRWCPWGDEREGAQARKSSLEVAAVIQVCSDSTWLAWERTEPSGVSSEAASTGLGKPRASLVWGQGQRQRC